MVLLANHGGNPSDTVTFILRQSDDALEGEIFPRAGYVRKCSTISSPLLFVDL